MCERLFFLGIKPWRCSSALPFGTLLLLFCFTRLIVSDGQIRSHRQHVRHAFTLGKRPQVIALSRVHLLMGQECLHH